MSAKDGTLRFRRNRDDVLRSYQSLSKKVNRLRAMVDRLDRALDSLEIELAEILNEAKALFSSSFDFGRGPAYPNRDPATDRILQMEGEKGIHQFEFTRHSNGKVTAIINGTPVTLSPVLGELLIILADRTPTKVDPQPEVLVSWKEAEEVRTIMQLRRGRHFSRSNVWNCVNKLRNCLSMAFLNPHFVQTNKEKGLVRLALRRDVS